MTCYFYINVTGREVNESPRIRRGKCRSDLIPAAGKSASRAYRRRD